MLTRAQANIIYESFYHGLDVHFSSDGNDYYLVSPKTSQITERGKLQVNGEMDFDIDSLRIAGSYLEMWLVGRESGLMFLIAVEYEEECPADVDEDDTSWVEDMEAGE